ncbi:MAG TPA: hypothetical protein VEC56_10555 [Candidatus Krumholzibacteria bacterium]|nr:hypothetical protein [Candidatus Krumholzibacteria bacterium]
MTDRPHSGDDIAAECRRIEIHIEELSQLFDSMDPSPFHKKDLDRNAAEYIASSALDLPRRVPLALVVYLDKPPELTDEGRVVGDAVREHFARESLYARRRLHQLLRRGWVSLAIGVTFLATAFVAGTFVSRMVAETLRPFVRESLLIGGWVAMWRPLETFLYDWWPIVGERRRYDRLSRMAVRIEYKGT